MIGEHSNEWCFAYSTASDETYFDEFVDVIIILFN